MATPNSGGKYPHLGDYVFFCDLCGMLEYASKATHLKKDTGHGNAMVCPKCVDATDYYLVPFKTPPEKSVSWVRSDTLYDSIPSLLPQVYPPYFTNPHLPPPGDILREDMASVSVTWDKQNFRTWNTWLALPWQLIGNT